MLFARLGSLIVKRHKLIIVLWLVALGLAFPLSLKVSSVTSLQQGSTSNLNLEAQVAQNLIDTKFRSGVTQSSLVVVISSNNVTTSETHAFVERLTTEVRSDKNLANMINVSSTFSAVSSLLSSAVDLDRQFKNVTTSGLQLFYGLPSLFVSTWATNFGANPGRIPEAQAATLQAVSLLVKNQTALLAAREYLSLFTQSFSSSLRTAPSISIQQRLESSISDSAPRFIQNAIPPAQRGVAGSILASFNLANFSNQSAIENYVVNQVARVTLFSAELARAAYPLAVNSSSSALTGLTQSIVVHPAVYEVPSIYKSTVTGFVSSDHQVMLVFLNFKNVTDSEISSVRQDVRLAASQLAFPGRVQITGQDVLSSEINASTVRDTDLILPVTIALLLVATAIFFRSVVTPFTSLGTISVALVLAQSLTVIIATYVSKVDVTTPTILLTVLIGVGTDYTVFLLARYREERVRGRSPAEGVHNSVTWAGESIATSGATVVISFIFLGFQSLTFLRSLGLVVGFGVLIALGVSLTLIPSILMLIPNRIFLPNSGRRFERYAGRVRSKLEMRTGYFSRAGETAIRRAKLILALALVATLPAIYLWGTLVPSYEFLGAAPRNLESVTAFNQMTTSFGAGSLFPTYAVLQFGTPVWNGSSYNPQELSMIDQVSNLTLSHAGILSVEGPTRPGGARVDFSHLGTDPRSVQIENNMNKMLSKDYTYALLQISLKESPYSQDSITITTQLRQDYKPLLGSTPLNLQAAYVGGAAGSIVDTSGVSNAQFNQVISYVMAAVAVVLLVVLGSLFLPLFAIVSVVMSIAWTLAATKLVFAELYNFPILFILPLTLFVLLLGLGMDYNIFILTRIREEATKGKSLNESITTAVENTGGIITAAAIILAGSLGALMLSSNLLLKEFGFAFFFSILIDAMVVRTYIVPAVMSLMGRWNWYAPGRLQRVRMKFEQS